MPCYIFLNNALSVCTELNTHGLFCMRVCSGSFATGSEAGGERERTDERRRERENRTHTQTDHTSAETAERQGQRPQPSPSESHTLSLIYSF